MSYQKNFWFWNIILAITILVCILVLTLHFKNWITQDQKNIKVISGFYHITIPLVEIDSIVFVERIPPMERLNGFSALEKEKGIFREFKDSLTNKKVYVFVDNINQQKLKLVYEDSLYVYFNLKDSLETVQFRNGITAKLNSFTNPN